MSYYKSLTFLFISLFVFLQNLNAESIKNNKIIYINPNIEIPFWKIMYEGIKKELKDTKYKVKVYSTKNNAKKELEYTIKAIKEGVDGIIISPTNSSACVTILKLANRANIPVVISDIGTDSGSYVSYISSDNRKGAYEVGKLLSQKMINNSWQDGKVGIIAIPQKRVNGRMRTEGFMQALEEHNIKSATIKQLVTWSEEETYTFIKEMINEFPKLRAVWLQTSNMYNGAIRALKDMNKENEILLVAFDAEPEFLELIPNETIIGSGMQQPYLMGRNAAVAMIKHLKGEKVDKHIQVPILPVSSKNIKKNIEKIKLNVLGVKE